MKILFVCLGNICRSPTAEAVMRKLVEARDLSIEIDSAGTAAYHIGKSSDDRSQQVALKRGIDMSGQRARKVAENDFYEFDFILAMDKANYRDLLAIKPSNANADVLLFLNQFGSMGYEEVPDPYYGGEQGFELVLDLLEDACEQFLTVKVVE